MDGPLDAALDARRAPEGRLEALSLRGTALRPRLAGGRFAPARRRG
jgi:hypothetical protein